MSFKERLRRMLSSRRFLVAATSLVSIVAADLLGVDCTRLAELVVSWLAGS